MIQSTDSANDNFVVKSHRDTDERDNKNLRGSPMNNRVLCYIPVNRNEITNGPSLKKKLPTATIDENSEKLNNRDRIKVI